MNTRQGSFRLFRFAGVDVYLHWLWFAAALYEINTRTRAYSSPVWNVLEYLALFAIVLLHEFGHALACKQTGGKADQIVLWPLGGIAYVNPPPRPAANLWSIAAGPLVNVALVFVFKALGIWCRSIGVPQSSPDVFALLRSVAFINLGLLIFNLLPIYPLDGGQILRSLLWFVFGRARSLTITAGLGLVGVAGLLYFAIKSGDTWFVLLSVFILLNCFAGLKQARNLAKLADLPRRHEFACPDCKAAPPIGAFWKCASCTSPFDTFVTRAQCPTCGTQYPTTRCLDCGAMHPLPEWSHSVYTVSPIASVTTAGTK
jgi:Zn-dependent protease